MARTRATARQRPANINFESGRVAAAKEIANARRNRINNIEINLLLPQGKNVKVKKRENVVRRTRVCRLAVYPARVRNVRYDRD